MLRSQYHIPEQSHMDRQLAERLQVCKCLLEGGLLMHGDDSCSDSGTSTDSSTTIQYKTVINSSKLLDRSRDYFVELVLHPLSSFAVLKCDMTVCHIINPTTITERLQREIEVIIDFMCREHSLRE